MQVPEIGVLLRIFLGEDDKHDHLPLYEAIVLKAREMDLAGATVIRGPMGFGYSSLIHTTKLLRLSEDLPLVIEIVDCQEKIDAFLPVLGTMMKGGLADLGGSHDSPIRGIAACPETGCLRLFQHSIGISGRAPIRASVMMEDRGSRGGKHCDRAAQ